MDTHLKEGTLCLGAFLVATGGRLFVDGFLISVPIVVFAIVVFVIGQSITRFEDFPNGQQGLKYLEARLFKKDDLMPQSALSDKLTNKTV